MQGEADPRLLPWPPVLGLSPKQRLPHHPRSSTAPPVRAPRAAAEPPVPSAPSLRCHSYMTGLSVPSVYVTDAASRGQACEPEALAETQAGSMARGTLPLLAGVQLTVTEACAQPPSLPFLPLIKTQPVPTAMPPSAMAVFVFIHTCRRAQGDGPETARSLGHVCAVTRAASPVPRAQPLCLGRCQRRPGDVPRCWACGQTLQPAGIQAGATPGSDRCAV